MSKELQAMRPAARVQSFLYPAIPFSGRLPETPALGLAEPRGANGTVPQQELAGAVAAAREKGFHDGEMQAKTVAAKAIELERAAIATAIASFAEERSEYFRRVEREAVRLALAIARKILEREAQMDPLLLAGIVRVALDQMQEGTRVELRVPPDSAAGWSELCSHHVDKRNAAVSVIADNTLKEGACVLQSEAGTTEISVESQLREIERGFFDRMREVLATDL